MLTGVRRGHYDRHGCDAFWLLGFVVMAFSMSSGDEQRE